MAVGCFKSNAWGLHDMHGNVWEWCADWYDEKYYAKCPAGDPRGPELGTCRVLRGGSWFDAPPACRSASRGKLPPESRSDLVGFRVVVEAKPR